MQMKPDELLQQMARLIDARAKTTETNLKAEIKASGENIKKELRTEIKASGENIKKELRAEILEVKEEIKSEVKALRTGIAKKMVEQEERLEVVEKAIGASSKH
ncbi:MAG TPA: hypothetical protein VM077_02505 [Candidatus Limnocylindrales bacterium]|nr:hypothetical protein [Candidatus Limnocylindrales bacterium]